MNDKPNKTERAALDKYLKQLSMPFVDAETQINWAFVAGYHAAKAKADAAQERKAKRGKGR